MSAERKSQTPAPLGPAAQIQREADALYQNDRVVARAVGAEVDLEAKEIRFEEIYSSDDLLLPEE